MKNVFRIAAAIILVFISLSATQSMAEGNALSDALPSTTSLAKQEECTAEQHHMMSAIGLGEAACTLSKYISFDSIGKAVGTSAFQSNSRSNPLNPSDNVEDFVRYSPQFFTRVNELYSKDADNVIYGFFYKHFLDNSTRLFYMTGKDMRENKNLKTVTLAQYKKSAKDGKEFKELYKTSNAQCRNIQVGIVKTFGVDYHYPDTFKQCGKSGTAALFWYRRQLDGSSDALFTLLDNVLKTQDELFYSQLKMAVKTPAPKTTSKAATLKSPAAKPTTHDQGH